MKIALLLSKYFIFYFYSIVQIDRSNAITLRCEGGKKKRNVSFVDVEERS